MRLIGLDYGEARIGIALSDRLQTIASPHAVYKTRGWTKDIAFLHDLIKQQQVHLIILGDPFNMDGSAGERSRLVHEFGTRLSATTGVPIEYVDERLTTVEMEEFLDTQGIAKQRRKEYIDKLAAQLILRTFMENRLG